MTIKHSYLTYIFLFLLANASFADGFNKTEVYSYQSDSGTPVFTDKRPLKSKQYQTQTIEAVTSSNRLQNTSNTVSQGRQAIQVNQTQSIVYVEKSNKNKRQGKIKQRKDKDSLHRCQRYKEKFDYYADKMRSGYRNSEYKKLEKNRKKYKNLLFNRCDTKTFKE